MKNETDCEHNFIAYSYIIKSDYPGDGKGKVPTSMKLASLICTKCGEKQVVQDPDIID